MSRLLSNFLMVTISLAVGVLLVELALRLAAPSTSSFHVWPPYHRQMFFPEESRFPGVSNPSLFQANSRGLRGDELSTEHNFQVLTVGGSTTECLLLDQQEAWPQRLQDLIDQNGGFGKSWVGNAGRSGHSTREHRLQVSQLLDEYPDLDALVLMAGVNDLGLRLKQDVDYDPGFLERDGAHEITLRRAFSLIPMQYRDDLPFYKRTELYSRLRSLKNLLLARLLYSDQVQDANFHVYDLWRERRRNARKFLDQLPDLSTALSEYRTNLAAIVVETRARDIDILLVTQPSMWRSDLSQQETGLLWWGGIGNYRQQPANADYYSVDALATGIEAYNQEMLDLCQQLEVKCLDLASQLPRDRSVFVDGVHFNENGARLVAEKIAHKLLGYNP